MAFSKAARRFRERREEERKRSREEERREEALRRQQEEERERQRQEERRQEALRQAQEFEVALEAARQQRENMLARLRTQRRNERREASHQAQRRAALLDILRTANRQERREAAEQAARQEEARLDRLEEQREAQQQAERNAERHEVMRQSRLEERREQERAEQQTQARRTASRAARQDEAQEAERNAEMLAARQEEARERERIAQRRAAARQANLEERRETERQTERTAKGREAERQARLEERRQAERADEARTIQPRQRRNPLRDRIPSGVLSGSLPWLRVNGNKIANLAGDPIILRGVSLLGLDSAEPHSEQGFAAGAGITEATINAILDWGVNVIRLAINRDRVLNGYGDWSPWDYLADLDQIIQRAAAAGAYTLLSLRRLDDFTIFGTLPGLNSERTFNYIAPQPDYDAIGMWRILGERYADEPAVLFDLYTAPHPPLEDDLTGFYTSWELWSLWIRLIVAELRRMHPRALCFISGLDWATDLSGFPAIGTGGEPIPNLIYAAHLYPQRDNHWQSIRVLHEHAPVFITEWAGGRADVNWGERIALSLRAEGIGWAAAHWNAEPFLVENREHRTLPTPFGAVVRRALALVGEPLDATLPTIPAVLDP